MRCIPLKDKETDSLCLDTKNFGEILIPLSEVESLNIEYIKEGAEPISPNDVLVGDKILLLLTDGERLCGVAIENGINTGKLWLNVDTGFTTGFTSVPVSPSLILQVTKYPREPKKSQSKVEEVTFYPEISLTGEKTVIFCDSSISLFAQKKGIYNSNLG